MRKLLRVFVLVAVTAVALTAGPGGRPAMADPGVGLGAVQLSGVYSSPLDATTTTRSVSITGTMVGSIGTGVHQYNGTFNLTGSGIETGSLATGSGSASVTLLPTSPIPGYSMTATCTLSWTRVGLWTIWTLRCSGTLVTPYGTVSYNFCISWATMLAFGAVIPGSVWFAVGFVGPWPC